jgi:phosphatidylglycerophosphatase A
MSTRPALSFFRPGILVASWFGCGFLPRAPGSWGALASLPLGWIAMTLGGPGAVLILAAAIFIVGIAAADAAARAAGEGDPQWVVIDEVAGQLFVLAVSPPAPLPYLAAFLLFRLFDIWKPFPIRLAERAGGGVGIMADDAVAALYAGLALIAGSRLLAG